MGVPRLKKRVDFLSVAKSKFVAKSSTMLVQCLLRSSQDSKGRSLPPLRVGFTASKKVGNAVARNRARRRLRALVDNNLNRHVKNQVLDQMNLDFVFVAFPSSVTVDFNHLSNDFNKALSNCLKGFSDSKI